MKLLDPEKVKDMYVGKMRAFYDRDVVLPPSDHMLIEAIIDHINDRIQAQEVTPTKR